MLRLFTSDADDTPIGVIGFSNINPHFKTASIWVVVGDKLYGARGHATRAASEMLSIRVRGARSSLDSNMDCGRKPIAPHTQTAQVPPDWPSAAIPLHRRARL